MKIPSQLFHPSTTLAVVASLCACGVAGAANIAGEGFAIMGVHTGILPTNGIQHNQAGQLLNINDQNATTRTDTWNGNMPHAETHGYSYVGVVWGVPRTEDLVIGLNLTMGAFGDGGWFGPNNQSPGNGQPLGAAHLAEPSIQVLGGTGWETVAHTSNYISQFTGHVIGVPNPNVQSASFTLTVPQTGITGIRIIGAEGGVASGGFIGVFELEIDAVPVPEPSALALGGLALALAARRRRAA